MTNDRACVLLVDDIDANLVALEAQLADLDCDLVRAKHGNDALRHLLKREFALMLLDVQMPDMDGYEVARYARENPKTRDVPIMFVTAMHRTEAGLFRGYGAGAVDLLFKPVDPYILRGKVQVFIDLYQARRSLKKSVDALERANRELETFSYSVAHDLRAPLRGIDGYAAILLEDYLPKLDSEGQRFLGNIRQSARHMGELIDGLLTLARLGHGELQRVPVDLSALAGATLARLRQDYPSREVTLVVEEGLASRGNPRLLAAVFDNLLGNAWKFTSKREGARIEVGANATADSLVYFVRDNGAGFNMAYAKNLFGVFQRLHTTTEFEGTGVGLATVERIVRRHGGRVWAEGEVDRGAAFYFTLDAHAAA